MAKQLTMSQLKNGEYKIDKAYRIYIVSGDGCTLYVGQSICAITRMLSHLGIGQWSTFFGTRLDRVLIEPRAAEYIATFLDEDEVLSLANKYDKGLGGGIDSTVNLIEQLLIYRFSPVFNHAGQKAHNENATRWRKLYPPNPVSL